MKKAICILAIVFCMLLLLSGLVVTDTVSEMKEQVSQTFLQPVLFSSLRSEDSSADIGCDTENKLQSPRIAAVLPTETCHTPILSDSNGHCLVTGSYRISVYELFRPEIAGG